MSLIPPGTSPSSGISVYASVQVAVTSAALYDHALSIVREVELIWMKPPSLVSALYLIERYLGDVVLIVGLCLCFSEEVSEEMYVLLIASAFPGFRLAVGIGIRLFQVRAWGALVYSWATQAIMQLRIHALYRRSTRILALLLTVFICEITAIAFIIWREIGPSSRLQADCDSVPGEHFCAFTGVNGRFVYFFIPFLCFELFLFLLAARTFVENMRRERMGGKGFRVNSFMSVLARDSICYFFVNLIACAIVMGLWQSVTELYANIAVPMVMFLEVLIGTRLVLDFRERYSHSDWDSSTLSGTQSPVLFRDEIRMDSTSISVRCEMETIIMIDGGEP